MNKRLLTEKIILYAISILLFAAALFQVVYKIDSEPVKIWDEASSAQNAIEMLYNKNYLVVYSDGEPDHFDTRPPMAVWTKVISYKIFGVNELAVRMPTIVSAFLIMLMLFLVSVRFLKNYSSGFVILILISCTAGFNFYHVARTGDPDTLLLFFVSTYILTYFILLETFPKSRVKYYIILGLAVVFAVFTKSIQGVAPLAGLFIYTFTQKNGYRMLKDYRFHITWITSVMVILLYYIIREQYDPGYIEAVFAMEFSVINKPVYVKHPEFSFYYDYLVKTGFYPFCQYLFIPLIPMIFSRNNRIRRLLLYSMIGGITFVFGISNATIKNEWYIAPVYPFLWLYTGVGFTYFVKMGVDRLSNYWIRTAFALIILAMFVDYCSPVYKSILKTNTENPNQYVYPPERAGKYLDEIKKKRPELKDIAVVSFEHPRQLKFYSKKYKYSDSTNVVIYSSAKTDLTGKSVIVCNDSLEDFIKSNYRYKVIDEEKYCKLYELLGRDTAKIKTVPLAEK